MIKKKSLIRRRNATRKGLSLLEVILALAILGVALATIGELIRMGSRSATDAREATVAQLLCESKMSEIAAGIVEAQATALTPFETDPDWLYSIETQPIEQPEGLLMVRVVVQQDIDEANRPVAFSLVRWIRDPAFVVEEDVPIEQDSGSESGSTGGTSAS